MRAATENRRRGQKGNAFVEAAFVLVPLLALIFAIIDFGLSIFVMSTLQHAVREGVRYAITYQTQTGMGHDASIKSVVQSEAMGFLAGQAGLNKIYIRYFDPVTLTQVSSNGPGNVIEVSVEGFTWGWLAPLLRSASPLTISSTMASDRMESLPGGQQPPPR
ncbi:MAG: pilus assembly protein [Bryobacteraceae bacterium]|nr:pilus assembly protein [Bryobacteraceae bacterium]